MECIEGTVSNEPCSIPISNEPCSVPASNEPCSVPEYNEPCSVPALNEPCSVPAFNEPCSVPAFNEPCSVPAINEPCSVPVSIEPCSVPVSNEPCSVPEFQPSMSHASHSKNNSPSEPPVSGIGRSLVNHLDSWRKLPNASFACNIISKGVRIPFTNKFKVSRLLNRYGKNRFYSSRKLKVLEEECKRLLNLGAIEEIPRTSFYFSNHIFYKIKPDGTIRLIFDMKFLNTMIKKPSFSMLKSNTIFPYLHLNSWACKLDLKDAYWHIPLHLSAQKFLTFRLGKRKFKWKVLPFGLKTAPYIFSKIIYTVIKYLRIKFNILIFNYLDDILILANNPQQCKSHTQLIIKELTELGWKISFKKSVTEPVQEIEFLGVHYDLIRKTMRPMQKNIDKCINLAKAFSNSLKANLKYYQMLIGALNFSSFYTFFGRFQLKFLHRFHQYFNSNLKIIPPSFKTYLKPWENRTMYEDINIPETQTNLELFTDASNQGWGGALVESGEIYTISKSWTPDETSLHINIKELLACISSIRHFKHKLYNKNVLIHVDSKVTKGWLKKQGSIRNKVAHEMIRELLNIMRDYNIQIVTKWIKGTLNTIADSLSRDLNLFHPEICLNDTLFKLICSDMNLTPEIDLFSNGLNSKCTRFCSSLPNPNAICNNALNISWKGPTTFYAFPPGFLLHKVAFKIYSECYNNMLFCTLSQGTEPWIPLVQSVAKHLKQYTVCIEDYQIVHRDSISPSARLQSTLIVFKI